MQRVVRSQTRGRNAIRFLNQHRVERGRSTQAWKGGEAT